jgi:FkbM family methyltransferase
MFGGGRRPGELTVTLPTGMKASFTTYSSQLGPFVDIFVKRIYEKIPSFVGKRGQVVFDLGANVGFYTLLQAAAVGPTGHVYAFEPQREAYEMLRRNVEQNELGWVTCVHRAVFSASGEELTLWSCPRWSSTASLYRGTRTGDRGGTVTSISLDDFVEERGIDRIDIVKMDTEGAEASIIQGGLRRAMPITKRVVMESHVTKDQVRRLLAPLGFEMVLDYRAENCAYFERRSDR